MKYFKSYQFAEVGEVGIMVILMVVFLFAAVVAIVRETKGGLNYLPAGSYSAAVANAILKRRFAFSYLIGVYRGGLLS